MLYSSRAVAEFVRKRTDRCGLKITGFSHSPAYAVTGQTA